jgi:sortase (surface protein transpeptidase)
VLIKKSFSKQVQTKPSDAKTANITDDTNSDGSTSGLRELDERDAESPATYMVAKDLPKKLTITKIGVDAIIKQQTAGANGQVDVPLNIHTVGWFDGSDKPAETGTMLFMGQVAGPTQDGVFKKLDKLMEGDLITVERGDGKIFYYSVVLVQKYKSSEIDAKKILSPINASKAGLNLMTFTGSFDGSKEDYASRLVVFAEAL